MKKASALVFRLLSHASRGAAMAMPVVLATTCLVACDDENDPKTWVKRLDDPAQRVPAIKRLEQFFNDTMGAAGENKREDERVKKLLDETVEPLAKTYVAGGLDDKTRKELMKLLGDMADPRAVPAYAKAFKDFEPGKGDDDVKFASQGTSRLAAAGQATDQALVDALWDCFAKFAPSKNTKSINLVKDLQGAVLAVKHPSYGPKATAMLAVPVANPQDPEQGRDQLQFWQASAARLVGELKYTAAVKPLVKVILTPTKADLIFPVRVALTRMPKEAEPVLIAALKGTDPELADLAKEYPERGHVVRLAEPLAYISRPAGLEALTELLASESDDAIRAVLATDLTHYPSNAKVTKSYLDAYAKVPPDAILPLFGGANAHAVMAQAAANFFDPSLTEWLLKEVAAAKGEAAHAMPPAGYHAAIKLMTTSNAKAVGEAVAKIPKSLELDMFTAANGVLEKCKEDTACYVGFLDSPIPSSPPTAKMAHVKAAWMVGMFGDAAAKTQLVSKVERVKDASVRLAMLEAIDHLSPQGDAATADKLEKLVDADRSAGVNAATDEMFKIALKLKSRVP